eukprot:TRINITY_DN10770_c0_g1_i1.p1 TRINITY_DN10770_c0_g1~~TRINITY_DN10770_c0_g1_i1.p1  ORF type:complete len:386 (-),score=67.45 TRINITY_DN10770_c0_g1_i1:108-1265(-)
MEKKTTEGAAASTPSPPSTTSGAKEEAPMFEKGDIIHERYEVVERIGRGGYGEIFLCLDSKFDDKAVAIKAERVTKPGNLLEELAILNTLKNCKHAPKLLSSGRHEEEVNYLAMELYGENISTLRRTQATKRFSLLTTCSIAMQMLRALREIHDAGCLHRDIKPGNFVIGTEATGTSRSIIVIDYGLSRIHLRPDGTPKSRRASARWVGSRRYMSLNTHFRKDQGRRDDIYSLLYVIIECVSGTLPWAHLRGIQNLDKVRDLKVQYNNERLVRGLPEAFHKWLNHVKSLKFESRPNYKMLHNVLKELYETSGGGPLTPLDWEDVEAKVVTSCIPYEGPGEKSMSHEDAEPSTMSNTMDDSEESYPLESDESSSIMMKKRGRCTLI